MASNWSLIPDIAQSKNRQRTASRLVGYGHREDCNWSTMPESPMVTVCINNIYGRYPRLYLPPRSLSRTHAAINTYVNPPPQGVGFSRATAFLLQAFYQLPPPFPSDPYPARSLESFEKVEGDHHRRHHHRPGDDQS